MSLLLVVVYIGVGFLLKLQHYTKEVSNWRLRPASPQKTQPSSTGQEKEWPQSGSENSGVKTKFHTRLELNPTAWTSNPRLSNINTALKTLS
jgi:hypothetical protein